MSSYDKKVVVDGSCLTDATCDNMVNLDKIFVHSTIHVALIARYMRQAELVYTAPGPKTQPVDVLDVGCNNAAAARLYASQNFQTPRRRPVNYVGLDLDPQAVQKARDARPRSSVIRGYDVREVNITRRWPLDDETFDVIWYTEAIEHVPPQDAQFTLHEAWRVARPGAVMLLSTPAPFDPAKLVWPESHDHEFSREEMRALLDAARWEFVDEYGLNTNWTRGRARLREQDPQLFQTYELLRTRLGGTIARTMVAALTPEVCDDLVHVRRKPS